VLRGDSTEAAVKGLDVLIPFAVQLVEIDCSDGTVLRRPISRKGRRPHEISGAGGTGGGSTSDAVAEQILPARPRAIGTDLQGLASKAVIGPRGGECVRIGAARGLTKASIPLRARALPERIGRGEHEAALRIIADAGGAGQDIRAAHGCLCL